VGGRLDSKLIGLKDLAFAPDGKTLYLGCQNAVLAYDLAADATSIYAGSTSSSKADVEGKGEAARFSGILGLAADANGNLVALEETCLVGIDKDRNVTVLAGTGKDPSVKSSDDATAKDGTGPQAVLEFPGACRFDKNGTLYFTDGSSLRTLTGTSVARVPGSKELINFTDSVFVDKAGVAWVMDFDGVHGYGSGTPIVSFGDDVDTSSTLMWDGLVRLDDGSFYASGDGALYHILADGSLNLVAGGDTAALADGKGTAARFGASGRLALGPDGALYMAEETALRKISFAADPEHPTVTTVLQGTGGLKKVTATKK
jgi:sugar lactone lactonase YvrE